MWSVAIAAALAAVVTAVPPAVERFSPAAGLSRSLFTEVGFRGVPIQARADAIDLRFLDEEKALPRQNFSVRWRGFFYISQPQTVEFFAGGNDEVELRVDGVDARLDGGRVGGGREEKCERDGAEHGAASG